ncbi:zinc finger protein 831 [Lissotriton helveticus]
MEPPSYAYVTQQVSHQSDVLACLRSPTTQTLSHPSQASGFESQKLYLNAVPVPLYHLFKSPEQHATGGKDFSVDSCCTPMILNPIVHSEKIDLAPALIQKQQGQTLTLNIVGALPILSPGCSGSSVGSPGKSKNAGKYICKHCGRDCFKPSVLEKHIRSHTGERPFPCTTCGIAFKTQSNLYKHRRTQTHVNNARLSSESDSNILEESEKVLEVGGEQHFTQISGHVPEAVRHLSEKGSYLNERLSQLYENVGRLDESKDMHVDNICPEMENNMDNTISTSDTSLVLECMQVMPSNTKIKGRTICLDDVNSRESSVDPQIMQSTAAVNPNPYVKKKLQEQRFSTITRQVQPQRQQVTYSEKALECPASERKLKKCESTDSGYLSHSDSMDQQTWPSSPLHSLCEQSSEAEEQEQNDSGPEDTGLNLLQMQHTEKTSSFPLEKKQLEEHISKLISRNKAVVDDTQLDNVRPRKTALSKQGSIDLPMPYTYKDSFHFDIKSLGGNRKNNYSLCSAKSTYTPLEKSKPLFFHSVPTQFSTTIDCVPVTRSNSLPFVESKRNLREQMGNSKFHFLQNQPLDPSFSSLLHGGQLATSLLHCRNSHPRALVRQSAVDHLPSSQATDYSAAEDSKEGRTGKLGSTTQCPTISKKNSRKKLKMFSQEKWQMYGDETFKKLYQKNNHEKAKKTRDNKESHLNDLTSLVSQLQVESSHGGFSSQADPKVPATSSLVSSQKPGQQYLCTRNGRETSQWTGHGSFRNLSVISPPQDPAHKGGWNKTVSIQGQSFRASPGFSESLSVGAPTTNIGRPKTPQPVTSQSTTNLTTPVNITQPHPNVQHTSLAGLDAPFTPGLDHASRTPSNRDTSHKAFSQCVQTICRLEESEYGGKSSVEPFKEGGKLPSERKKVKVEDLGQRNQLHSHSSASNATHEDSSDTIAEARLYAISSPLERSHYPEEGNKDGIIRCANGLACAKTYSQASDSPLQENTKASLDAAGRLTSTLHVLSQHSDATVEQSSILEKHQNPRTPSELKNSVCTVGREHNLEALVCTPPSPQQSVVQSAALKQSAFSPKYLLKLPAAELLCTPGRERGNVSHALSDSVTGSSLNTMNGSIKLSPPSVFPPKHTEQSVIVGPIAERGTFLAGFPSNSLAMSIITCMANTSYGKNNTYPDKTKVTDSQYGGSGETKCVVKCSKTNTDQAVQKSNQTLPWRSVYKGTGLLLTDCKRKYELTHCLLTGSCLNLAPSYLCSGKPPGGKQEEPAGTCNPYTPCKGSIHGHPLIPLNSSRHAKIPAGNVLEPCHPTGASISHMVTIPQCGVPFLSKKGTSIYSGKGSTTANINFPSLNTEVHMTWCCLSRNLSCTVEQKKESHPLCSSPHSCLDQSTVEKPSSSCRVSVLNTVNTITYSANSSTTTDTMKDQESLVESPRQQFKRNPDTLTNSANTADQTAKAAELGQTELNSATRHCRSKKLEITKNRCRGGQLHGHTRFRANRLHKKLLLPHKMSAMRKKHLPKMHNGLRKSRKSSCHGNKLKKISRSRSANEQIPVVPERTLREELPSEEDKYTEGPPAEPCHPASTCEAGPGRADAGSPAMTQLTCPISIDEPVRARSADISSAIPECQNTASDLPALLEPSPTTNRNNLSYSGPPPASFDSFISTPPSPVLQNPDLLEGTESTLPGPDTSSCWHFTPEDNGAFLQHLFDVDPLVAGFGGSEVKDNNSIKETDGWALPRQGLGAPLRKTHVRMGRTKVETREISCPSTEKDVLLGVFTTCSLPSELMDTAVPTITGYCGIFCNSEEDADAAVGISTVCQDECDTFDGWREGTVTYQVNENKLSEASPSLMASLNLGKTSDIAQRSTKKRSLEMTRKQTQVEYTDTSSDDDRLVIEIEN